jgi:hypothetical protein
VQNPFRSEASAYRFLLTTVGAFAAIVVANELIGAWAALVVFLAVSVAIAAAYMRARSLERPAPTAPVRRGPEDERRILVIANETVGGQTLRDMIREKSEGYREEVLVVVPALNSPVRHWASDEDGARAAAGERLARSLSQLREVGVDARGEIGDSEPLQAIEDWLRIFTPDEIIISTHPEGRSHWLERGVVRGARERFAVPITHVVVDLEAEREEVR